MVIKYTVELHVVFAHEMGSWFDFCNAFLHFEILFIILAISSFFSFSLRKLRVPSNHVLGRPWDSLTFPSTWALRGVEYAKLNEQLQDLRNNTKY